MKAVCWQGKHKVSVETVPDPTILDDRDAIIKITKTAICGSDLHLYNGYIPTMQAGDILGHEFMGEVVETGKGVSNLKKGDKVVVPFTIACGNCFFCKKDLWSACDNSNPKPEALETAYGFSGSALFGYSHMMGGFAGGQAEYVRVPFADVGPMKVPNDIEDEKVLFLSDIFPTGYEAAENCNIQEGDTVAVWGAGPVGQFAVKSAFMLGAEKVVVIDHYKARLAEAMQYNEGKNLETINFDEVDVHEQLKDLTGGRGPDSCIDCVGLGIARHFAGCAFRLRESAVVFGNRPTARVAADDFLLSQRRHDFDSRRLRRISRQIPDGRGVRQRSDFQNGTDEYDEIYAAAFRSDSGRKN